MATFLADFLYDSDGDLLVQDGDFVIGLADNQYIEQIIDSNRGEWLFHPLVGVGIKRFQNGDLSYAQLETTIQQQLRLDGYEDIQFNLNQEDLQTQLVLSDNLILNIEAYRP